MTEKKQPTIAAFFSPKSEEKKAKAASKDVNRTPSPPSKALSELDAVDLTANDANRKTNTDTEGDTTNSLEQKESSDVDMTSNKDEEVDMEIEYTAKEDARENITPPKEEIDASASASTARITDVTQEDDSNHDTHTESADNSARQSTRKAKTAAKTKIKGTSVNQPLSVVAEKKAPVKKPATKKTKDEAKTFDRPSVKDVADGVTSKLAVSNGKQPAERRSKSKATATTTTETPAKASMKKGATAEELAKEEKELDPMVKARIATFTKQMKDLSDTFYSLRMSSDEEDMVKKSIYGAESALALESIDKIKEQAKEQLAPLLPTLAAMKEGEIPDAKTEFPDAVKHFLAVHIQGNSLPLSTLTSDLIRALDAKETFALRLKLETEVKALAQRESYGVSTGSDGSLYEDMSPHALWTWEVHLVDKYFSPSSARSIKKSRKNRRRVGTQLKTLSKVITLLQKQPLNEAKVSLEEVKIGKLSAAMEQEMEKEVGKKEKEKAVELEKQRKVEESRKRKREEEEKKKVEEEKRRRQSLTAFFTSVSDSKNDDVVQEAGKTELRMQRMDASVPYLHSSTKDVDMEPHDLLVESKGKTVCGNRRKRGEHRMKLLQFHENYRPAYFGTFRKKTNVFRRGRRPFALYSGFDYSVDSDDEWEEEEPGESLSTADSDSEDEDDLDYGDTWLAYEDEVEYVDGENDEVGEEKKDGSKKKRVRSGAGEKDKVKKLEPKVDGPHWCDDCETERLLEIELESSRMKRARVYWEEVQRKEAEEEEKAKEQTQASVKETEKEKDKEKEKDGSTGIAAWLQPDVINIED